MVCVGIDVAKDKHDCCILDSDGTVLALHRCAQNAFPKVVSELLRRKNK